MHEQDINSQEIRITSVELKAWVPSEEALPNSFLISQSRFFYWVGYVSMKLRQESVMGLIVYAGRM